MHRKNIDKVNIRFLTDSGLRLVNDSGATTKGSPNNVAFSSTTPKRTVPPVAVAAAAVTTEKKKIRWDKSRRESYPVSPSPCV